MQAAVLSSRNFVAKLGLRYAQKKDENGQIFVSSEMRDGFCMPFSSVDVHDKVTHPSHTLCALFQIQKHLAASHLSFLIKLSMLGSRGAKGIEAMCGMKLNE